MLIQHLINERKLKLKLRIFESVKNISLRSHDRFGGNVETREKNIFSLQILILTPKTFLIVLHNCI